MVTMPMTKLWNVRARSYAILCRYLSRTIFECIYLDILYKTDFLHVQNLSNMSAVTINSEYYFRQMLVAYLKFIFKNFIEVWVNYFK